MPNQEETYTYQHIVDNSPKLNIKRKLEALDKDLLKSVARELSYAVEDLKDEVSYSYACQAPLREAKDSKNLPSYRPEDVNLGEASSIVQWLMFQGLQSVILDSQARQFKRSKDHDKECRSENGLKFDDESFATLEATVERETKADLEEQKDVLIKSMTSKDANGKAKTFSNEEKLAMFSAIQALEDRIEAMPKRERKAAKSKS